MGYTIDIDTGGTFTDGFFVSGKRVETVKVPTTPHDLTVCFLECIKAGAERFGLSVEDLLYETDIVRFSNTIGTNTIIQRDGSRLGLLVTSGTEGKSPTGSEDGKAPLVQAEMVVGIDEEVSAAGEVVKEPEPKVVMDAAQILIDRGARCLVVALTNSEFNSANERLIRKWIKAEYPRDFLGSVPVFLASDISSRRGEAERINAAVLNAYIHSKLVSLLYKAGENLRRRLYGKSLYVVHNNNAVARVAKTRAINTYNSGPAAGLMGARLTGDLYKAESLISADMGGTSFDLGYVRQGQPSYSLKPDVEGFPVNVPMIEIRAVGAGGGSIASVENGILRVGPRSAGALPGPVCFDLGGVEPTVTDADLVLGILDPDYFLGGTMKLNAAAARTVMEERAAKPLGISVEEAALLVKRTIDAAMGKELLGVKKTLGGEESPLMVVYGGAGPAHCCRVAEAAGIKRIVITPFSAVFSAFSSSSMDVGHIYYSRADLPIREDIDYSGLERAVESLRNEAERDMRGEGVSPEQVQLGLELFVQAGNDGPEVKVNAPHAFYKDAGTIREVVSTARGLLGMNGGGRGRDIHLNTLGLMTQAKVAHFEIREIPEGDGDVKKALRGTRATFLEEGAGPPQETPVYDRARLTRGHELNGPALVDSEQTTILVPSGWRMTVDRFNHAILEEVSQL